MFHIHHRGGCGPRARFAMRGGGFGRHGGHWEGRDNRRRRMFDGEELRLILLKLIADEPRHGYDLIRGIEERTGGAYAPSAGVVYPTLTMLDDMGLAEAVSEGSRRQYAATEAGRTHLAERAGEVEALMARLDQLGAERARVDRAPIRRAMQNLHNVLHHRLGESEVDAGTLHTIAALLDEAAQKIERL